MIRLFSFLVLLASPAAAHVGPHIHPHAGSSGWIAGLCIVAMVAFLALGKWIRR